MIKSAIILFVAFIVGAKSIKLCIVVDEVVRTERCLSQTNCINCYQGNISPMAMEADRLSSNVCVPFTLTYMDPQTHLTGEVIGYTGSLSIGRS